MARAASTVARALGVPIMAPGGAGWVVARAPGAMDMRVAHQGIRCRGSAATAPGTTAMAPGGAGRAAAAAATAPSAAVMTPGNGSPSMADARTSGATNGGV